MDFQKHDNENRCEKQWMQSAVKSCLSMPIDKLGHERWRFKWRGCLENDGDLTPLPVKSSNGIAARFPGAAVPFIFGAMAQKVSM
jgi:hypothetical protein